MSVIIILFLAALASLFSGLFISSKSSQYVALVGILIAIGVSILGDCSFFDSYHSMILFDGKAKLLTQNALVIVFLIILLGQYGFKLQSHFQSELYALMLFSLCGAVILFSYQNLITLFLGIEILSIPIYILAGSNKNDLRSNEAAMKYFLMGSFATGFLLFGIALLYGSIGSFDIHAINVYSQNPLDYNMFFVGVLLMMIGMLFKVSVVPFHLWSPDVYEGSPSIITAFMASVVKMAGFGALYKLIFDFLTGVIPNIQNVLLVLTILTLIVPNIIGLVQKNAKRVLAFSSVSHAGYLLLVFFSLNSTNFQVLAFYLLVYSIATVGAFTSIIYVERSYKGLSVVDTLNGLAKKEPLLALGTTVSLLSMAGIPMTAGFIAKLDLLVPIVDKYLILVIIALIGSAISIAYYLRLIVAMYFKPMEQQLQEAEPAPLVYRFISVAIVIVLLLFGVFPNHLLKAIIYYF